MVIWTHYCAWLHPDRHPLLSGPQSICSSHVLGRSVDCVISGSLVLSGRINYRHALSPRKLVLVLIFDLCSGDGGGLNWDFTVGWCLSGSGRLVWMWSSDLYSTFVHYLSRAGAVLLNLFPPEMLPAGPFCIEGRLCFWGFVQT